MEISYQDSFCELSTLIERAKGTKETKEMLGGLVEKGLLQE